MKIQLTQFTLHSPKSTKDIRPTTPVSDAMSKDMGLRGFKFRGSTICYAFMQAVGMANDHLVDCPCKSKR